MSLVVFKAVSEDEAEAMLPSSRQGQFFASWSRAGGNTVTYYLLLKRIHRRASYNLSQFTPFRLQRRLLHLLAVVSLREPVCTTVAVTAQHVQVPWGSASRSRIRKRG